MPFILYDIGLILLVGVQFSLSKQIIDEFKKKVSIATTDQYETEKKCGDIYLTFLILLIVALVLMLTIFCFKFSWWFFTLLFGLCEFIYSLSVEGLFLKVVFSSNFESNNNNLIKAKSCVTIFRMIVLLTMAGVSFLERKWLNLILYRLSSMAQQSIDTFKIVDCFQENTQESSSNVWVANQNVERVPLNNQRFGKIKMFAGPILIIVTSLPIIIMNLVLLGKF